MFWTAAHVRNVGELWALYEAEGGWSGKAQDCYCSHSSSHPWILELYSMALPFIDVPFYGAFAVHRTSQENFVTFPLI